MSSALDKLLNNIKTNKLKLLMEPLVSSYKQRATLKVRTELIEYLKICDLIHSGRDVLNYSRNDLPEDSYYEYVKELVNYVPEPEFCNTIFPMGSINKEKEFKLNKSSDIIVLPKFDGVSVGIELVRTNKLLSHEFQINFATTRQKKICTLELRELISNIFISKLMDDTKIKGTTTEFYTKDIQKIKVRGEFLMRVKEEFVVAAATVSGILRKGISEIRNKHEQLCVVLYEVAEVVLKDNTHVSITQSEALKLLGNVKIQYVSDTVLPAGPTYYVLKPNEHNLLTDNSYNLLNELEKYKYPLDGLVYCDSNWIYPLDEASFNKVSYGKFAWKPSMMYESYVTGLQETMAGTGKYSYALTVIPLMIDGKVYSKCKVQYYDLLENGTPKYRIGDKVKVVLVNLIGFQIQAKLNDTITDEPNNEYIVQDELTKFMSTCRNMIGKPVEYSTICSSCGTKLNIDAREIYCKNSSCRVRLIERYSELMTRICKLAKNSLQIYNESHTGFIKTTLTRKRLEKLNPLNLSSLIAEVPNFMEVFNSLTLVQRAYCVQQGGLKTLEKCSKSKLKQYIDDSFLFEY